MYVDPWTGRHAADCASWETSRECPSRKTDFETVAVIFKSLLPKIFEDSIEELMDYADTLDVVDEPDYDGWSSKFGAIGAPAVISNDQ